MFELDGSVALVTGGGRGIGRAIAGALAGAGARVAVTARSYDEISAVASEIEQSGGRATPITCDVRDETDVRAMVAVCRRELGNPDIVVNNAGNAVVRPFVQLPGKRPGGHTTLEDWNAIMSTHLTGAFFVLQETVPSMLDAGFGRVINISSVTTRRAGSFTSAYDTAKGGLISLTRSLAYEWARNGVTVNCVAPGQFPTAMSADLHESERGREWVMNRIPMRRAGDPDEVGAIAVYLSSREAGFVTGQCIYIDGGEGL